jgi:hypothetical protein
MLAQARLFRPVFQLRGHKTRRRVMRGLKMSRLFHFTLYHNTPKAAPDTNGRSPVWS